MTSLFRFTATFLPKQTRTHTYTLQHRAASALAWPKEGQALIYEKNGDPRTVLQYVTVPLPQETEKNKVKLAMLQAPINPADINMVQGTYHIRPTMPAVGGNEGVGVVVEVGSNVSGIHPGDWVIPHRPASGSFGTWRTHAVVDQDEVQPIPKDIPLAAAATIGVNPCTAYRMLHDFVSLNPGDVIIQNGANSAVGQCVIQVAKEMGVHTINIIRDETEFEVEENTTFLKSLGADMVVTESFAQSYKMRELMKGTSYPNARLALNCVGGESVATLSQLLGPSSKIVTYGGMSRRPVTIPTAQLLFKQIEMRGFWMTRWVQENSREERRVMLDYLAGLVRNNRLRIRTEAHPFSRFHETLDRYFEPNRGPKLLFAMDHVESASASVAS